MKSKNKNCILRAKSRALVLGMRSLYSTFLTSGWFCESQKSLVTDAEGFLFGSDYYNG